MTARAHNLYELPQPTRPLDQLVRETSCECAPENEWVRDHASAWRGVAYVALAIALAVMGVCAAVSLL